eukprot:105045-Chlamydomonas_euryale.AAC.2
MRTPNLSANAVVTPCKHHTNLTEYNLGRRSPTLACAQHDALACLPCNGTQHRPPPNTHIHRCVQHATRTVRSSTRGQLDRPWACVAGLPLHRSSRTRGTRPCAHTCTRRVPTTGVLLHPAAHVQAVHPSDPPVTSCTACCQGCRARSRRWTPCCARPAGPVAPAATVG